MHMLARVSKITDLSFAESKQNLWSPQRTGDYNTDTAHGRRCADELLDYMRLKEDPLPFGQVTRAITEGGVYGAVEIGFCSRMGIHLLVGSPSNCVAAVVGGATENPAAVSTRADAQHMLAPVL